MQSASHEEYVYPSPTTYGVSHTAGGSSIFENPDSFKGISDLSQDQLLELGPFRDSTEPPVYKCNEQLMNSMLYNNNNDPIFFCDNEIRYGSANNGYALQNNDYCGPNGQTEESSLAAQLFSPPPEIKPLLDYWVTNRSYTMPDRQQWAALEHVIPWSVANKYIQQGRLSVALQSQTEPDQPDERSSPHGQLLPSSRSLQDSSRSTRTNQENAGSSKVRYSCIEPGCNANFVSSNRESCKRHLRDHTQPSEIFICTVPRSDLSNCGFKHHRIDKFKDHLESEHNLRKSEQQHPHKVDNPDRCRHKVCPYPQCGEEFNIPEDYYEHYLHHYEGEGRDDGASLCTTTYTTHNNGREGRDSRYLDGGHDNYSMGTSSNSNRGSQRRRGSRRAAARSNNRNNNNNNNQEGSKEKPRRPRKRKNGNQFPTETTTYGSNGLECNNATTMTSLDNNWLFNGNDQASQAQAISSQNLERQLRFSNETAHAGSCIVDFVIPDAHLAT